MTVDDEGGVSLKVESLDGGSMDKIFAHEFLGSVDDMDVVVAGVDKVLADVRGQYDDMRAKVLRRCYSLARVGVLHFRSGVACEWGRELYAPDDFDEDEAMVSWLRMHGVTYGYPDREPAGLYYEDGEVCAFEVVSYGHGNFLDTVSVSFSVD